ncbi:MAG TPA: c-type cytochrome [Verrucomicrobiae bacterium]|nr:c-type cytochrome [Verrucomicrobiae bacterium]
MKSKSRCRAAMPWIFFCAIAAVLFGALGYARQNVPPQKAQPKAAASAPAQGAQQQTAIARGKYLVEQVAKCGECHTPRDSEGNLDGSRWLNGATIWIRPVHHMNNWAEWAPRLAGLPSFTDEQAEAVLEKGIGPNGAPIRPPMHVYHMDHADAMAIVAYLRSLQKSQPGRNPQQ